MPTPSVNPSLARRKSKLTRFLELPFHDKLNKLSWMLSRLKSALYYPYVFASFGAGSTIVRPLVIGSPHFMHIGKKVIIREGVRLQAVMIDPENPPELIIGDNVNIEAYVHIAFMGKVRIGDNASIATRCSILGGTHPFFDAKDPTKIGDRVGGAKSLTEVGSGSLIGIGTTILVNARVGKNVVVGTNSVVKSNLPDFCVAEGNPAVPVLKYDPVKESWINLKSR